MYTLREAGYIRDNELAEIRETGAVGDYLGFHYDKKNVRRIFFYEKIGV